MMLFLFQHNCRCMTLKPTEAVSVCDVNVCLCLWHCACRVLDLILELVSL